MKTKIIIALLFIVLIISTVLFARLYINERKDSKRLENNFASANASLEYYKAENGNLVAKNDVLELKHKELANVYPKILQEIKDLKIKVKRVNSYSETVINNEKQIITQIKDSVIKDTVKAKVFEYKDEFYNIKGIAINDTQQVKICSVDSLIQVVYKGERYNPRLWIFSKRKLQQSITSKNPNSVIIYSKNIEIVKR